MYKYILFSLVIIFGQSQGQELVFSKQEQTWLAGEPSIKVAFDANFPPYSFLDDAGELNGLAVEVINVLSLRSGIKISPIPYDTWADLYQDALDHKVDLVATMVERPERLKNFEFTPPYIHKSLVVISQHGSNLLQQSDLKNKDIALVEGYQYVKRILQQQPDINPIYVKNMLDALNQVSIGQADATISFIGAAHFLRSKYQLSNLKYAFVFDQNQSSESIAIRKDRPILASIIKKTLSSISVAELQVLRQKWLPKEINNVRDLLTQDELNWIAEHPAIRLGVDQEFAPFEFYKDNVYQGMTADYINLLNSKLGLNMQPAQRRPWQEVVAEIEEGNLDVLPAVAYSENRERFLNFTAPYLSFHRVIISRNDLPFITGIEDIATLKIGVQRGSSHHEYMKEQTNIKPILFNSLSSLILAVSDGTIDAMVGSVASASYWIRDHNLLNLKVAAPVSTELQSLHFAVREDWPILVSILQKGLDSLSSEEHYAIRNRWINIEYDPHLKYKFIVNVVIACFAVIALFLVWTLLLNSKVKSRTRQIIYQAKFDSLTDLPNRYLMQDRINQQLRNSRGKQPFALISIDLIGFKAVNDVYGYQFGDKLLSNVASILQSQADNDVIVGRLGGDQFLLMLPEVSSEHQLEADAERYLDLLNREVTLNEVTIQLKVKLGISLYPADGNTASDLIRAADMATNYAKKSSKQDFAIYQSQLNLNVSREHELLHQLHGALERNEFTLFYQPKMRAKDKRLVGFEALIRWNNEQLGSVPPAAFIPYAESSGLIDLIGNFVLETALKQLHEWQQKLDPNLSMAINISPYQLDSETFLSRLKAITERFHLASETIELEITESTVLEKSDDITRLIKQLQKEGIRIALDDFGTGYSSLSYLRRFRFDTLKIDREFVEDMVENPSGLQLVKTALALGHSLDLEVVAEGVETEAQAKLLTAMGCNQLQGWLYGKAMNAESASQFIKQQHPETNKR